MHFSSVSQCRSVAEGVRGGAGGLQSTAGQGTSAYCRLRGVYSKKSTVKSTVGQGGSKGSTVEKSTVVSGIPFTVDCRHWQKTHVHPDMCMCTCMC